MAYNKFKLGDFIHVTGKGGYRRAAKAIHDWSPGDYHDIVEEEIDEKAAFIDALTEIGGLSCRNETIDLIKKHSKMRGTFFASTPIICNDITPDLERQGEGNYFYTDSHLTQCGEEDVSFRITAVGSYEQPGENRLISRFAILRKNVLDENGEEMVVRYPLWMIDNRVIDLLHKHNSLELLKDIQVLINPTIHDLVVHSAIRDFDNDSVPKKNPILGVWSQQIHAPTKLPEVDRMINYEHFATILHYQVTKRSFEKHPALKRDYEEEIRSFTQKLQNLREKMLQAGEAEEIVNETCGYLAANVVRPIAYVMPKDTPVFSALLEKFPAACEQSSLAILQNSVTRDTTLPIHCSEHELDVFTLTRAFFEGVRLECFKNNVCPVYIANQVERIFAGNADCPASMKMKEEMLAWLREPAKREIVSSGNPWQAAFMNRLPDELSGAIRI